MPELPEVETTRAGLEQLILGKEICQMKIYDARLRWPVVKNFPKIVKNTRIASITRRSKYLFLNLDNLNQNLKNQACGAIMIHLGMSGRLQVVDTSIPREKHSHIECFLSDDQVLRYTDPRRFGSFHWIPAGESHKLLDKLGPEPLSRDFTADYLEFKASNRVQSIKQFIMNAQIVVGVGNIYASEALFLAQIHPLTPAKHLKKNQYRKLVEAIQVTLKAAIKAGGTTLKDFQGSTGKPGYFQQKLNVYGRKGEACSKCGKEVQHLVLGQRATYFCQKCQK